MGCGFSALGSLDETKVHNINSRPVSMPTDLNFA